MEQEQKTLSLEEQIVDVIKTCYDPEIPVNIYELGLVYDVIVDATGLVGIRMTLTAPACPAAQSLPIEVRDKARGVPGVTDATVSDAARLQLGLW
jgi:metal-sulfur cluster biosynthetic enzyme